MLEFNPNISSAMPAGINSGGQTSAKPQGNSDFADAMKAVEKHISNVDDAQRSSDLSIQDLLTGKNSDITTVVTEAAKADMSFKVLVGVRNKLIEAYKQTMSMPI